MKILFITPSLYIPGGVERVLTMKMNWLARHTDWDINVCLTDGMGKEPYYPLDHRIKVYNLNIGFEELWHLPFYRKVPVYLRKQRLYRKKLAELLHKLRPDITDSLLRREINFLCSLRDGSAKVGELHVNRKNYRNFESHETNFLKEAFSKMWMEMLLRQLKRLDRFVVLTQEDAENWPEVPHVEVIPNPVERLASTPCHSERKRVIAVGRYSYQKGFDLLIDVLNHMVEHKPALAAKCHLLLYGNIRNANLLKQIAIPYTHLGKVPESQLNQLFSSSDVVLSTSRFETLPGTIIEGLASGCSAVAFDSGGQRDIIDHLESGYLARRYDVNDFVEGINWAVNTSAASREVLNSIMTKRFSAQEIAQKYIHLFEE